MSVYRDPAEMSENAVMRENTRLRREVEVARGSVRRAWQWACLWVCVCGSIAGIQHMILRGTTGYAKFNACPSAQPCQRPHRTEADITCEKFRNLLTAPR